MRLTGEGSIVFEASTEAEAQAAYSAKKLPAVQLTSDTTTDTIFTTAEMGWMDFDKVGSKAANYAELAKALNTSDRKVVPEGFAIPFFYYQQFLMQNPSVAREVEGLLRDPLMNRLARASYRKQKLERLQNMIRAE